MNVILRSSIIRLPITSLVIAAAIACAEPRHGERADLAAVDTLLPVGGTRLYVRGEGRGGLEGPAIVLHGGPLLDHGYLRRAFGSLHERLTLVYFDQRLSGRSDGVVDSASVRLDTLVHDIDRVRTAFDLGRVHLVGHSWGGLLALTYALEHPAHVRSLLLLSPIPPSADLWRAEQELQAKSLSPQDTAGMGAVRSSKALSRGDPEAIERLLRLSFRQAFADPDRVEELTFHIEPDYQQRSRQFAYLYGDLASYDLTDGLSRLSVPTLVIFGDDEVGAEIGSRSYGDAPCARVVRIPDSGHFPFVEQPQSFARTAIRFYEHVAQGVIECGVM
jgi:proline iminopeptidase